MRYIKFTYITTMLLVNAGLISAQPDFEFLDRGGISKLSSARLTNDEDSITDKNGATIPYVVRRAEGKAWSFNKEKNALEVRVKNDVQTLSYDFFAPPQPQIPARKADRPGQPDLPEVPAKDAEWKHYPLSKFSMIELRADVVNNDKHKTTTKIRLRNDNTEASRIYDAYILKSGENKIFRFDLAHAGRQGLYTDFTRETNPVRFNPNAITGIDFLFEGAKNEDNNYFTKTRNKTVDTFAIKSIKVFSSDELNKGNHGNIVSENDDTEPVPEPFSMITMGSGILGFLRRRKLK